MVRRAFMTTYRLLQSRRHIYQLLHEGDAIAEIAIHRGARANVTTADGRYDLQAIEAIRKRVVKLDGRNQTVARSSSLGRYAVDLEDATLYWHSQPGPAGTYCWMTGDGLIVARYSPQGEGTFVVQVDDDSLLRNHREDLIILGSYLLIRTWIDAAPAVKWPTSLAFAPRAR